MANIVFNNGITVDVGAFGANPVLDDSLVGIANDYDISIAYEEYNKVQADMRIKDTQSYSVHQLFGYRIGGRELAKIQDNANKKKRIISFGNKKGYLSKDFGEEIECSYKMYNYLRNQQTLSGADSDVKEAYTQLMSDTKDLTLGKMETFIIEQVALFTQGFAVTADYGPGSATPNLQSVFSATHPILSTGGTFSNILSTPNKALSNVTLQEAIDILKTGVKLQNGKFVKQGAGTFYQLYVGTTLAVTARQILNTYGKQAGMYSGDYGLGSGATGNANQINKFFFEGNLVEIVELPNLGDIVSAEYGYGSTLGLQTNWFVMNPFVVDRQIALRKFEDYSTVMKNYQAPSNDKYIVDIRSNIAVDHYYVENGIVGSKGTTP